MVCSVLLLFVSNTCMRLCMSMRLFVVVRVHQQALTCFVIPVVRVVTTRYKASFCILAYRHPLLYHLTIPRCHNAPSMFFNALSADNGESSNGSNSQKDTTAAGSVRSVRRYEPMEQQGVLRTNCIDCVVSFCVCLHWKIVYTCSRSFDILVVLPMYCAQTSILSYA
jgi:hypothetical protein